MKNIFDLTGKKAIVTGASSGLGVQYAIALARQGADVALLARRYEKMQEVKEEIKSFGRKCVIIKCDVTVEKDVEAAIKETLLRLGRIDILVNNAGNCTQSPTEKMREEDWDSVLNTNLKGSFFLVKHAGQHMIKQKYGRIINISSLYGLVGNNYFPFSNYHVAKSGVIGLTKALAVEWAKYNITVNAIAPGLFDTEMTHSAVKTFGFKRYIKSNCPMKRIGSPGELNGILIYLASDTSSYTTGQIIAVDGGWTSV